MSTSTNTAAASASDSKNSSSAGNVALITGGAKGIGKAILLDLVKRGWKIAFCYRTSEKEANELVKQTAASNAGSTVVAYRSDVSDAKQCETMVNAILANKDLGRIDALINCAGPYHKVNVLQETNDGWKEMFTTNLDPLFYLAKLVSPGMQQRKYGRIIAFSMANADQLVAQPQFTAHYISKVGVLILAKSLAKVLAPFNVTVNVISPGFVESGSAPSEELTKMVKMIPAGYVGSVTDAVSAANFLLSNEARYVNGSNIHLSGGWGI